jgi:integrase
MSIDHLQAHILTSIVLHSGTDSAYADLTAWRALREAAGLRGLRFHDLRHTVVTRLLEAGEADHVVESITGHLSRRMLEHYSHIRLTAKRAALDRLSEPRKARK